VRSEDTERGGVPQRPLTTPNSPTRQRKRPALREWACSASSLLNWRHRRSDRWRTSARNAADLFRQSAQSVPAWPYLNALAHSRMDKLRGVTNNTLVIF
jgi:hypothetical protein